jgi:undecaprenyl diphosphate synthase
MDGNRRYARQLGQPIIHGHTKGAETASNVLKWWLRFLPNTPLNAPQYLTVWAFSSDNFKRSQEELNGLFTLMAAEFKSLAFTSLVHLFRIRVRVIGDRSGLPVELVETIDMLEELTSGYGCDGGLYLQVAVGYGGRDEIVRSVKRVMEKGGEMDEKSIAKETECGRIDVPGVELIVRTSERR